MTSNRLSHRRGNQRRPPICKKPPTPPPPPPLVACDCGTAITYDDTAHEIVGGFRSDNPDFPPGDTVLIWVDSTPGLAWSSPYTILNNGTPMPWNFPFPHDTWISIDATCHFSDGSTAIHHMSYHSPPA